jgi:hypothetical protein
VALPARATRLFVIGSRVEIQDLGPEELKRQWPANGLEAFGGIGRNSVGLRGKGEVRA